MTQYAAIVTSRSNEHRRVLAALENVDARSIVFGVLRQELDSYIRVLYLLSVDTEERIHLLKQSLEGKKWTHLNKRSRITDRDMVEHSNRLDGWSRNVYEFGCAFIHLSTFHKEGDHILYADESEAEVEKVRNHIMFYHDVEIEIPIRLQQILEIAPQIFGKITDNLEGDLKALIKGGHGSDWADWTDLDSID